MPHFHDVRTTGSGYQNAQCTLTVIVHFVTDRLFIAFLYLCDVAQTQLVVIMSLNKHFAYIFYRLEFIIDSHTDPIVTIVIIAGIGSLVLTVQGSKNFSRLYTQICHTILQQRDIDALRTLSIQIYPVYPFQFADFTLNQFGIVRQLTIRQTITGQSVKHTVHIPEVVFYNGSTDSFGQ